MVEYLVEFVVSHLRLLAKDNTQPYGPTRSLRRKRVSATLTLLAAFD